MKRMRILLMTAMLFGAAWTAPAMAHCDTLDGPVVAAARSALATGQVEQALIWVRKQDERAIRSAFGKARDARAHGAAVDGPAYRLSYPGFEFSEESGDTREIPLQEQVLILHYLDGGKLRVAGTMILG